MRGKRKVWSVTGDERPARPQGRGRRSEMKGGRGRRWGHIVRRWDHGYKARARVVFPFVNRRKAQRETAHLAVRWWSSSALNSSLRSSEVEGSSHKDALKWKYKMKPFFKILFLCITQWNDIFSPVAAASLRKILKPLPFPLSVLLTSTCSLSWRQLSILSFLWVKIDSCQSLLPALCVLCAG